MESALIFTCVMADARACARASTCSSARCAGSGVSGRCTLPINKKNAYSINKSVTSVAASSKTRHTTPSDSILGTLFMSKEHLCYF